MPVLPYLAGRTGISDVTLFFAWHASAPRLPHRRHEIAGATPRSDAAGEVDPPPTASPNASVRSVRQFSPMWLAAWGFAVCWEGFEFKLRMTGRLGLTRSDKIANRKVHLWGAPVAGVRQGPTEVRQDFEPKGARAGGALAAEVRQGRGQTTRLCSTAWDHWSKSRAIQGSSASKVP